MSLVEKIDLALESYYNSFEHLKEFNPYRNDDNAGKFSLYCEENGIEDDDIEIELEAGAQDCCLIEFDYSDETNTNLFPLNKPIFDQTKQNQEIFRIMKNMYIDAKTPQHKPSQNDYIFTGQEFVYETTDGDNAVITKQRDDVSLLLYGYIKEQEREYALDDYVGGIPSDIIKIMIFFYGKKYIIHGPAPDANTEYDYAMEILAPIFQIGVRFRKNKVINLTRQLSQNNIIFGSKIIQINDIYITEKMEQKTINELVENAKRNAPSYIVFRSKKEDHQKGTHLQFDVSFPSNYNKEQKFPYYKFRKDVVQSVFDEVFGDDGIVDIMEIYANRQTMIANGTWGSRCGVSILIFINNDNKLYKNYEIFEKIDLLQHRLRDRINKDLLIRFSQKLESIKANGINCGWKGKRKSLWDLCWMVKENGPNHDNDDILDDIWYFIMVDIEKFDLFQMEHSRDILNVTNHGHILLSRIGIPPSREEQLKVLQDYTFESNTEQDIMQSLQNM